MPRLLAVDTTQERILKEYIAGQTVAEQLKAGRMEPAGTGHVPSAIPGWIEHRLLSHQLRSVRRNALLHRLRVQYLYGAMGL